MFKHISSIMSQIYNPKLEISEKSLTPREFVETIFIKHQQIELERHTRFMRELTLNYDKLKQIDKDAIGCPKVYDFIKK